jgi:hypothetical protein
VGYVDATFSCNLALLVDFHAGKATTCGTRTILGHWNLLKLIGPTPRPLE